MRKILSLLLTLCLLCGAWLTAGAEMYEDPTTYKAVDSPFATFKVRRSFKLLGDYAEEGYYEGYYRANYSYSMYTDAYYLDRIELSVTLTQWESPEAAALAVEEAMALQLPQEPEGSAYVPMELEDGTVIHVLVRPGDGFEKPYECRGVKGNLVYCIMLHLSDPSGEPEDRELLINDVVLPVVVTLQEKTETAAE